MAEDKRARLARLEDEARVLRADINQTRSQQRQTRREKELAERQAFRERLRSDHLDVLIPDEVEDSVWNKAWEDGHSSGYTEVEMYYEELADLVNAAFDAGRKN